MARAKKAVAADKPKDMKTVLGERCDAVKNCGSDCVYAVKGIQS